MAVDPCVSCLAELHDTHCHLLADIQLEMTVESDLRIRSLLRCLMSDLTVQYRATESTWIYILLHHGLLTLFNYFTVFEHMSV